MAPYYQHLRAFVLRDGRLVTVMLVVGIWGFDIWDGWFQ